MGNFDKIIDIKKFFICKWWSDKNVQIILKFLMLRGWVFDGGFCYSILFDVYGVVFIRGGRLVLFV